MTDTRHSGHPTAATPPNHLADDIRYINEWQDIPDDVRVYVTNLADRVERLAEPTPVDASTELTASIGLEPEQEIRDRALGHAIAWVGHHWVGGTRDRNGILDVADQLATYIRDGSRPNA